MKPMRQVLTTLESILSNNMTDEMRSDLVLYATSRIIGIVFDETNSSFVKSAIHALDHFLTKSVIHIPDVIFSANRAMNGMPVEKAQNDGIPGKMNSSFLDLFPHPELVKITNEMFLKAVQWIRYPDAVHATGRFVSTFFKFFREWCQNHIRTIGVGEKQLPVWLEPVKISLTRYPELFELFRLHIVPRLLRLNAAETAVFLKTLPMNDLRKGTFTKLPLTDIRLSLLTAQISKEKTLREIVGMSDTLQKLS